MIGHDYDRWGEVDGGGVVRDLLEEVKMVQPSYLARKMIRLPGKALSKTFLYAHCRFFLVFPIIYFLSSIFIGHCDCTRKEVFSVYSVLQRIYLHT